MFFGYLVHCQNVIRMQKLRAKKKKDDKIP